MASEVDICNIALSRVSQAVISSLTEPNERSRKCNLLYPNARDAVLRDHDWGFARKRQVLALLADTYTDWDFAYSYPTDCLQARRILDPTGVVTGTSIDLELGTLKQTGKVQFDILSNADGNARVIVTNKEDAELEYTKKITDTNVFDSLFIEMLGLKLAADLAVPLTGKANLLDAYTKLYEQKLAKARGANANEGYREPDNVNVFLNSRG